MLLRLFHTLRHLRARQFVYRIRHRFWRPQPDPAPAPPRRACPTPPNFLTLHPQELNGPRSLILHGEEADIPDNWQSSARSDLWNYHLHYFDDLNAHGANNRTQWHRDLIASWIASNPPRAGVGWDAYPTALRIVNWVKWGLRHDLTPEADNSLALQVRVLRSSLEYHLLANHLFADAKGLFFAGLWFGGSEAGRWLTQGRRLLEQEIAEQVLADGGHYERSPMYHQTILLDLLDIDAACRGWEIEPPDGLHEAIQGMRSWATWMSHPDGEIAFFNDACFGAAPGPAELETMLAEHDHLPDPIVASHHLMPTSGFFRLQAGPVHVLMDVGDVGPAYQPGHAHAESLAIEISAFGHRLFVNSGVSKYGTSTERQRQRGSAAHNTLTFEGHNSSDVWSGFRVGERARVSITEAGPDRISVSHDGYRRLNAVHTRRLRAEDTMLEVTDELNAAATATGIVRWFLHPDVVASDQTGNVVALQTAGGAVRFSASAGLRVVDSTWHPRQGGVVANQCLEMDVRGGEHLISTLTWDSG